MGDILSQAEIDALLNSIVSGETIESTLSDQISVKEAKVYNFARPSKFNKDQLKTLEIIFDNFARMVSSFLTGYLRTHSHVEVANAEQMTYSEFNNSLSNPVILGLVDFKPLKGTVILELSANIGYSIIDRILGGPGLSMKKLRDFSEIEKILLERVLSQIITYTIEPWENILKLQPSIEKIETNSQFAQIISPNEMIALVTLSVKIGSSEGLMNFAIPHLVIEPIMKKLNTKFLFSSNDKDDVETYSDDIVVQLEKTKVYVSAVVGRTSITVNDFVNLQVGDIIPLDSYISSDLNIMVGDLLKFHGKPGISKGKNAIQITSMSGKVV